VKLSARQCGELYIIRKFRYDSKENISWKDTSLATIEG